MCTVWRELEKGVDGRYQWGTGGWVTMGTRETEVRLDGWCEGGGDRGMTVEAG